MKQGSLLFSAGILISLSVLLGLYCGDAFGIKDFVAWGAGLILVTFAWVQADRWIMRGVKASQWCAICVFMLSILTYMFFALTVTSYNRESRQLAHLVEIVSMFLFFGAVVALFMLSKKSKSG